MESAAVVGFLDMLSWSVYLLETVLARGDSMSTQIDPTPGLSTLEKVARALGVVGMFPVGFMCLAAGLVAPTWAVGVLLVIWVLLFVA